MAIVFDVETTTFQKGNVHARRNKMLVLGARCNGQNHIFWTETQAEIAYAKAAFRDLLLSGDIVVAHNAKFDLQWIRRWLGVELPQDCNLWDTSVAHFVQTRQRDTYPSLDDVCRFHGVPGKLDVVKTEYWGKGIDTDAIPRAVLEEYLCGDLEATERVYEKQRGSRFDRLIKQCCWDTRVLAEMEWNGLAYDCQGSLDEAERVEAEIATLDVQLQSLIDPRINWASPQQVAAVLYGGVVEFERKETYLFVYKDPRKTPIPKTRTVLDAVAFPRLVSPRKVKGEESRSVDEGTLQLLQTTGKAKAIVTLKLKRSKLSKLVGTYYKGLPQIITKNDWEPGWLHPTLNQTRAITGRLSSDNPNEQNLTKGPKKFVVSRYND